MLGASRPHRRFGGDWERHGRKMNDVGRRFFEPKHGGESMAVTECRSCGAEIRGEGLPPSFGGYNVYCVTCGAQFRVD